MEKLQNTLSKINSLNIQSRAALETGNPILYHELCLNISSFITGTVFRSHKNKVNLMILRQDFCIEPYDVHIDCLVHILDKLDRILTRDAAFQIPYLYTMCNHIIIDTYRKTVRYYNTTTSLNETVESMKADADSKKNKLMEDYMKDKKADIESNFIAKETVIEIYKKYSGNADSLLCAISSKILGNKPKELAHTLLRTGSVDAALEVYTDYMLSLYHIGKSELPAHAPAKTTGITKILSHMPPTDETSKELTCKISNITNRTK